MFKRKKKHCISWCGPTDSHRFETMEEGVMRGCGEEE
jgi:tartrate dehydratase beta subunit/fumarate hydratase class I family protein